MRRREVDVEVGTYLMMLDEGGGKGGGEGDGWARRGRQW